MERPGEKGFISDDVVFLFQNTPQNNSHTCYFNVTLLHLEWPKLMEELNNNILFTFENIRNNQVLPLLKNIVQDSSTAWTSTVALNCSRTVNVQCKFLEHKIG